MRIYQVMGEVRVNGVVYESPNGIDISGTVVTDSMTGQPVQPKVDPNGGER